MCPGFPAKNGLYEKFGLGLKKKKKKSYKVEGCNFCVFIQILKASMEKYKKQTEGIWQPKDSQQQLPIRAGRLIANQLILFS